MTAAKAELAAAQEAIVALGENPSPEELTAALRDLVNAQQSLIDAQDALARTRYALSEDKRAELEEQIVKLNRQIADQSEKLQLLVERSSAMQQLMEEYAEMMDLLAKQSVELQQRIEDLNDQLSRAQVIDITRYPFTISLAKSAYRYTGKPIRPAVRVAGLRASDYSVSYAKVSGNKKIRIDSKTGKVTVKKGLKKGSYKVRVRAAGNINNVGKGKTSFTRTGLVRGMTYYVQVRELRKVGGVTYIGNISCPVAVRIK